MITLRRNTNRPLTWDEMDNNFIDLDGRIVSLRETSSRYAFETLADAQAFWENLTPEEQAPLDNVSFVVVGEGEYLWGTWESLFTFSEEDLQAIYDELQETQDIVTGIGSGEGGKSYPTLADALADDIPDNVVFQTPEGIWRRDSSLPEGAEFLREHPLDRDELEARILPIGQEFENIDRPDISSPFVEVNENLEIINIYEDGNSGGSNGGDLVLDATYDRPDIEIAVIDSDNHIIYIQGIKGESHPSPAPDPQPIEGITIDNSFDRPDIPFVVVDEDYFLIYPMIGDFNTSSKKLGEVKDYQYIKKFWNPPEQPGFSPDTDPWLIDYDLLVEKWDGLIEDNPTNPEIEPYITKNQIGLSSFGNLPIYRYDFTPPNPKHKILLVAGQHANEKTYIKVLYDFMNILVSSWFDDSVLEWLRWNVEILVIPVMSPATLSHPKRELGSRMVQETEEFPVSWTKTGSEVTITFAPNDFPDTNGRFVAEQYFLGKFNGEGLAGNTAITITESSDESGLSNYLHMISEVVDGTTIKVDFATGGASSGTAVFCVWTDSNRQMGDDEDWIVFNSGTETLTNGDSHFLYENKGTQPFSSGESIAYRDTIITENVDFVLNGHCPPSKHYLQYHPSAETPDFLRVVENIKNYTGQFDMASFRSLGPIPNTPSHKVMGYHYFANRNILYGLIEWGGHLHTNPDPEIPTGAMRWMTTIMTEWIKLKKD